MAICRELYIVLFRLRKCLQTRNWTGHCDQETLNLPWFMKPNAMREQERSSLKVLTMENTSDTREVDLMPKFRFSM